MPPVSRPESSAEAEASDWQTEVGEDGVIRLWRDIPRRP